jgi:O-antigen ligase
MHVSMGEIDQNSGIAEASALPDQKASWQNLRHLSERIRLKSAGTIATVICGATLLGWIIAHEQWIVLLALLFLALALRWPVQVGLGSFAMLVPFDYVSTLGAQAHGRTLTWFIAAFAAILLFGVSFLRRRLQRPPAATLWWMLLVIWGGASTLWAIEPQAALQRIPTALGLLAFYLAITCVRINRTELQWVAALTIAGGLAAGVFVLSQSYSGKFYEDSTRASLVTDERKVDPNVFSATLLLPLSLAIGGFVNSKGRLRRMAMLAAAAVIGFAVFLTMSRGAILAAAAMVFVFLYRMRARIRLLIPISILLLLLTFVPNLITRFQQSGETRGAGRLDIWIVGLVSLKRYGFAGAGLENFPYAFREFAGYEPVFHGFYVAAAHNIYLQMSVELGLVGILAMLVAIVTQLRDAKRVYAHLGRTRTLNLLPYEAACWGMLVSGFFLGVIWLKAFWLCWILLAIATKVIQPRPAGAQRTRQIRAESFSTIAR